MVLSSYACSHTRAISLGMSSEQIRSSRRVNASNAIIFGDMRAEYAQIP